MFQQAQLLTASTHNTTVVGNQTLYVSCFLHEVQYIIIFVGFNNCLYYRLYVNGNYQLPMAITNKTNVFTSIKAVIYNVTIRYGILITNNTKH